MIFSSLPKNHALPAGPKFLSFSTGIFLKKTAAGVACTLNVQAASRRFTTRKMAVYQGVAVTTTS